MFANRFTAFLDACVLAGALKRNLLLSLAEAGLFRPRWSEPVLQELERALRKCLKPRPDLPVEARIKTLLAAMHEAFPEASVKSFSPLPDELTALLPDMDDAHVLAAARQIGANVIVTDNRKDFPPDLVERLGLEVRSADIFIADAIDLHRAKAIAAIRQMREGFRRPEMTGAELLRRMEAVGLVQTAAELAEVEALI